MLHDHTVTILYLKKGEQVVTVLWEGSELRRFLSPLSETKADFQGTNLKATTVKSSSLHTL